MKSKWFILLAILVVIVLVGRLMAGLSQDLIWKWKVKGRLNELETRAWALRVISQTDPLGPGTDHQRFLSNAPVYLLKHYRHRPQIIHGFDCIHLRYGGGMYSWGLTIGATNLPASSARGQNVQQWAPGIYYWNL